METLEAIFTQILKRDGSVASFDLDRITEAIFKAAQAVGGEDRTLALQLAHKVVERLQAKDEAQQIPSVEEIQDTIEKTLIEAGHAKTAKAFILYRKKRQEVRETRSSFLAIEQTVDQYLQNRSACTSKIHFQGLQKYVSENILSHYALNKIYSPEISQAHRDGLIYIHGLGSAIVPHSLSITLKEGLSLDEIVQEMGKIRQLLHEWSGSIVIKGFDPILKCFPCGWEFFEINGDSPLLFFEIQGPPGESLTQKIRENTMRPGLVLDLKLLEQLSSSGPLILQPPLNSDFTISVVSLCLQRFAQEATSKKDFLKVMSKNVTIAREALSTKKKVFEQNLVAGLFPQSEDRIRNLNGVLAIAPTGLFQASQLLNPNASGREILIQAQEILSCLQEEVLVMKKETGLSFEVDSLSTHFTSVQDSEPRILEGLEEHVFEYPGLLPFITLRNPTSQIVREWVKAGFNLQAYLFPK